MGKRQFNTPFQNEYGFFHRNLHYKRHRSMSKMLYQSTVITLFLGLFVLFCNGFSESRLGCFQFQH